LRPKKYILFMKEARLETSWNNLTGKKYIKLGVALQILFISDYNGPWTGTSALTRDYTSGLQNIQYWMTAIQTDMFTHTVHTLCVHEHAYLYCVWVFSMCIMYN
jgi:hypothetical protein